MLKCVRAANTTTIVCIIEHLNLAFTSVQDVTCLEFPNIAPISGNVARVPILTGTAAQEGRVQGQKQPLFAHTSHTVQDARVYDAQLIQHNEYLLTMSSISRIQPKQYSCHVSDVSG